MEQSKWNDPDSGFVRMWETVSENGRVKGSVRNWVIPSSRLAELTRMLDMMEAEKEKS